MPAPLANRNAIRHGLAAGNLPRGSGYIVRLTNQFRSAVEDALRDAGHEVDLVAAATIHTCVRWERHAQLAQRWLRREADSLTPDQRLAFSRDIARASAERDKCLRLLGLEVGKGRDAWGALDATYSPTPMATPSLGDCTEGREDGRSRKGHPEDQADEKRNEAAVEKTDKVDNGIGKGVETEGSECQESERLRPSERSD